MTYGREEGGQKGWVGLWIFDLVKCFICNDDTVRDQRQDKRSLWKLVIHCGFMQ